MDVTDLWNELKCLFFLFSPTGFSIEGPSQARIECNDNGDGSADVRYWPTIPGEYAVHILCNDEDIPLSPFMAWIEAPGNFDAGKVRDNLSPRSDSFPSFDVGEGIRARIRNHWTDYR